MSQTSIWFQMYKLMIRFCSFSLGLTFDMMAYYHFLIKQFSYSFNKNLKKVLENNVMVEFSSNMSKKRLEFQSNKVQKFFQDMLSTWFSLDIQKRSSNYTENQPQLDLSLIN